MLPNIVPYFLRKFLEAQTNKRSAILTFLREAFANSGKFEAKKTYVPLKIFV